MGLGALAAAQPPIRPCENLLLPQTSSIDSFTQRLVEEALRKSLANRHLDLVATPTEWPVYSFDGTVKKVEIPLGFDLGRNPEIALQALVGLPEHPFRSKEDPSSVQHRKQDQLKALQAFEDHAQDHRKGLLVAPPGFGKSLFAHDFLSVRKSGGLTIVAADLRFAVQELDQSLADFTQPRLTMNQVRRSLARGQIPQGLWLTTTSSLRNLYASLSQAERALLRSALNTLVYDEAHHMGAPHMSRLMDDLDSDPEFKGYLLGLTATPFHLDLDLQELFDNQSYWAYLDDEPKWGENRPPSTIIDQIYAAISRGELTPFNRLFFLTKEALALVDPLFITPENGENGEAIRSSVLNPDSYPVVFSYLKPLINCRSKTLLIANSIAEAERLKEYLGAELKDPVFLVHSDQKSENDASIAEFRAPRRGLLIGVRMLDESINIPGVDLIVDLNSSSSVRQFIQRLGRGLRLADGKYDVDFVSFNEIDEDTSRELIEVTNSLRRNQKLHRLIRPRNLGTDRLSAPQGGILSISNGEAWAGLEDAIRAFWTRNQKWLSFSEARATVQALNFKNNTEFREASRAGKLPNVPRTPYTVYPEWKDWGDFLGTGTVAVYNKRFRSYAETQKWLRENGIQSAKQFRKAITNKNLPADIPRSPNQTFKNEWKSWGDFFGNGQVSTWEMPSKTPKPTPRPTWKSYEEARAWIRTNNIKSTSDFEVAVREGRMPQDIPRNPRLTYGDAFLGWGDFTGSGRVAPRDRKFRDYAEAKVFVQTLKLKSKQEYTRLFQSQKLPADLPARPEGVYTEWTTWGDFLGNGKISRKGQAVRFFDEARTWVRSQNIKSGEAYRQLWSSGVLPLDLPGTPNNVYSEWVSWGDFLGTGATWQNNKPMRSFDEAKAWVRENRIKSLTEYQRATRPSDMPSNPHRVYKDRWVSWDDFFSR